MSHASDFPVLQRALLDALPEGALVLDADARITVYNDRALALLQWIVPPEGDGRPPEELTDLPAAHVLDQHLLDQAFAELSERVREEDSASESRKAQASFAISGAKGRVLRIRVQYLREADDTPWLLLMERPDSTGHANRAREQFLRTLTEGMRGPLANVRAAIETMTSYPNMDPAVEEQFKQIILEQSVTLSSHLDRTLAEYSRQLKTRRGRDIMIASDFLGLLKTTVQQALGFVVRLKPLETPVRLRVDAYTLTHALVHLAELLENAARFTSLTCGVESSEDGATLFLLWEEGGPVSEERLDRWLAQHIELKDSVLTTTVGEVLEQHNGSAAIVPRGDNRTALEIYLPVA